MRPIMDVDLSNPPKGITRTIDGRRDVEEWGLKVQKMASVHSITLVLVSPLQVCADYAWGFADMTSRNR
jgi:hypothetical protein